MRKGIIIPIAYSYIILLMDDVGSPKNTVETWLLTIFKELWNHLG